MKQAYRVTLSVIVVAALAGLCVFMWKVERRDREDTTLSELASRRQQASIAKSVMTLVDRLQALQQSIAGLEPSSTAYIDTSEQITEVQNLIASQIPSLVVGHDEQGNALIVPAEETRNLLNAVISRGDGP